MGKYIEREAAIIGLAASSLMPHQIDDAAEALQLVPAADVVPVVRCGECRYSYDSVGGWCCSHGICVDCIVREDFFCADGERKDGDGE